MEIKTFDQWSKAGYQILKGSKAVGTLYGQPAFDRTQVRPVAEAFRGVVRRNSRRNFYDGGLRGEQGHYSLADNDDVDYEADRDSPEYDDAYNRTWGGD